MRQLLVFFALLICGATSFAQPALADTSRVYFHDGKFSWHTTLSALNTFLASSATMTEAAQDAVGSVMNDGPTVNFTYQDASNQITADVITQMSVTSDGVGVKLVNDAASPGVSKLYGTDGSGTKGWFDQPAGGGGGGSVATDAIFDAKGDLPVGTGANTAARLPVGTDGKIIYADASTSTGLRWGAATISPSQITADQDNYNPTGWAGSQLVRISGDNGIRAITSLAATFDGDRKAIMNIGGYNLYLPSGHPDGTSGNRILGGKDYQVPPNSTIDIIYDATSSGWRVAGVPEGIWSERCQPYVFTPGSTTAADWGYIAFSTSSGTLGFSNGTSSMPSAAIIGTGTTTTGAAVFGMPKTITNASMFGSAHLFVEMFVSTPSLSDGTNAFSINAGLFSSATSTNLDANNTCGIRYTHSINAGDFTLYSRDGSGVETTVDSNVPVVANALHILRVEVDKSRTEIRYYINGAFVGRITTNLPSNGTAATPRAIVVKSAGTTAKQLNIHRVVYGAYYN